MSRQIRITAKKTPARPSSKAASSKKDKPKRYAVDPLAMPVRRAPAAAPTPAPEPDSAEPELIESVPLDLIEPDFWQGRRPLPRLIRERYRAGAVSAEQAIREWIEFAQTNAAASARLAEYRGLAASIEEHEQINPSAVVRIPPNVRGSKYRIESGERRFWAKWLAVVENGQADRLLKVVIRDRFSARRQAEENTTQSPLNAVELARTVARTFLEEVGVTPEASPVDGLHPGSDDFYRLALRPADRLLGDGRERFPRGTWPAVERTMKRKAQHLERLLQIMSLPDDVLDLADEYGLNERVLRTVLEAGVPRDRQRAAVEAAGSLRLTSSQVQRLCAAPDFAAELELIKAEVPLVEGDAPGKTAAAKSGKRASPARRPPGLQLADRIVGIARTVKGFAKGQGLDDRQAIESLLDEAIRLKPNEARDWLFVLEPLVVKLRTLMLSEPRKTDE